MKEGGNMRVLCLGTRSVAAQAVFIAVIGFLLGMLHEALFLNAPTASLSAAPQIQRRRFVDPLTQRSPAACAEEQHSTSHEEENAKRSSVVYSILTTSAFHRTRLTKVMNTWAKHANVAFITTDKIDPAFPQTVVLGEGERDLGGKTLQAFEKFCELNADFFILIDDDGFVVTYNVEHNLTVSFDRNTPLYGGYTLTHTHVPFVGGGGGIVVSNATMRRYCAAVKGPMVHSPCRWRVSRTLPGDVAVSSCMQSLGISATHIDGFSPFPMSQMVDGSPDGWCARTWWIPKHLKCNPPFETAMTMHYVPLEEFDELYKLVYGLQSL